ncbi:MAG: hypothetical protein QGG71_25295 [Pirellulaceae bacterium]|jgi:hypothetical protein|nr:hypothetical protein [Planctomycetaceae bacterium]MDP6558008.1 hypothetical protein [Pirellulaceae bacterium]
MQMVVKPDGALRCLYGEEIDLHAIGKMSIERGSHVEPTNDGHWMADLSPVDGPLLGPFRCRTDALTAERQWLEEHWLFTVG